MTKPEDTSIVHVSSPSLLDTHRGSKFPTSRLSAPFQPIDADAAFQQAADMITVVTRGKLELIVDQIKHLQEQARRIIMEAELDAKLHTASCSFEKRAGHTYHLYRRDQDDTYFSILSPEEWGTPPHEYLGSYVMNGDMSWTRVDDTSSDPAD